MGRPPCLPCWCTPNLVGKANRAGTGACPYGYCVCLPYVWSLYVWRMNRPCCALWLLDNIEHRCYSLNQAKQHLMWKRRQPDMAANADNSGGTGRVTVLVGTTRGAFFFHTDT